MFKETFRNMGTTGKLFIYFLVFVFLFSFGTSFIMLIPGSSSNINVLKFYQVFLSVISFALTPIICGFLWYEKPWKAFSFHHSPTLKQIFLAGILILVISPFINLLAYINEQMVLPPFLSEVESLFKSLEETALKTTQQMLDVDSLGGVMINLLVMAVVPALCEELFFRGGLMKIFTEKGNKHAAVWIAAVIFSLIHFQMYGFLPRMLMGALLGYLLVWSGSIWLPILVHFLNNSSVVLLSYFGKISGSTETVENLGKAETWEYGIVSAVVSGVILWMLIKTSRNSKLETQN